MTSSSPARPSSRQRASPLRSPIEEILAEDRDRNSAERHRYLLEAARREHERVRAEAERVYREQLKREERERLLEERRKEEERIRLEQQLAESRARLNELRQKKVEIPPLLPEPEPPAAPAVNGKAAPTKDGAAAPPAPAQSNGTTTLPSTTPATKPPAAPSAAPPQAQAQEPVKPTASLSGTSLFDKAAQPNGVSPGTGTSRAVPPPATQTPPDRYAEIHRNLKALRKSMAEQATRNRALKERMGDMRREIRKSVGQLTVSSGVAGANRPQVRAHHVRVFDAALLTDYAANEDCQPPARGAVESGAVGDGRPQRLRPGASKPG